MKVPYAMTAAVPVDERHAQMDYAVKVANDRNVPRLALQMIDPNRSISLACYGPSLADTWQDLKRPILSMSGATKWLADRGVIADYHADMDPRAHKVKHLVPPVPGVQYLMASVCPPETWALLKDQAVTLWHVYSGVDSKGRDTYQWAKEHDPGARVLRGGSTIGLAAFDIGMALGFSRFEIHGMDGSFKDGARHTGVHYGKQWSPDYTWDAEGKTYRTTQIMANAVSETINRVTNFPGRYVFHGQGLTQALVREAKLPNACTVDQAEKVDEVRSEAPVLWERCLDAVTPADVMELIDFKRKAEPLRRFAKYDTGSIGIETATLLRGASKTLQPTIAVEVGTFIGFSTYALQSLEILTCDKSNNCLRADPDRGIRTHPYTSASEMFTRLLDQQYHGKVDLVFLDGRLDDAEAKLLVCLSKDRTVFLLDDCADKAGHDKGLSNMKMLQPLLPNHVYVPPHPPFAGRSTLGALVPK